MENYEEAIGIDVSKLTIDVHIHKKGKHHLFTNSRKGFIALLIWSKEELGDILFFYCFENTGHYSLKLSVYLTVAFPFLGFVRSKLKKAPKKGL